MPKSYIIMMRMALRRLGDHSENAIIIGDRVDTDIEAGIEAGMTTYLVLTGVAAWADLGRYPYQPDRVFDSVAEIPVE